MAAWFEKFLRWMGYKPSLDAVLQLLAQSEPVPPKAGRSSVEEIDGVLGSMSSFMQDISGLNPVVPFDILEFLTRTALVNPDFNHATTNLINLSNNGHSLVIDAGNDNVVAAAHDRLNDRAQNIYPRSAGVDGLINHYIEQIAVTGAISSEDVISAKRDGVQQVVLVPTERIRFKYLEGAYKPFQYLRDGRLIELNEITYQYFAFRTAQNSPYAIPLYLAAVENVLAQRDMQKNLNFIMRKFGLLGLVALSMQAPPKKPAESDNEHASRKEKYLNSVLSALQKNFLQGLMVKYSDQTLEHHNITGEARGSKDIWDMNEQQIASGMGVDPTIIGRNYTSTETFANVTYMFMIRQANNIRLLAKRRMEKTYALDLRLQGIPVTDLSLQFNENPARDPLAEAQARETRERAIFAKVEKGVIDPDTAAQELGYENWFDVSRLGVSVNAQPAAVNQRRAFVWNAKLQRYAFLRPRTFVLNQRQTGERQLASEETVNRVLSKWQRQYRKAVEPFLGTSIEEATDVLVGFIRRSNKSDFGGAEEFAEKAFASMSSVYVDAFSSPEAQAALRDSVKEIYEYYRLEDQHGFDKAPKVSFTLDAIDTRSMRFMRSIDSFYLGKYIFNPQTEAQVLDFLKTQWLENGEGLFGRTSREALRTFQSLAVDRLTPLSDYEAQRIINTSVQRMRTWANIGQIAEAGFEFAKIYNPSPEAEICQRMNGEIIPIGIARAAVDEMSQLSPAEFERRLQPITPELIDSKGIRQAVADGEGFPPYHPNCKTRLIATEEKLARRKLAEITRAEMMAWLDRITVNGHAEKMRFEN